LFNDASDDNLFETPTVTSKSTKKTEKNKLQKTDLFGLSSDEESTKKTEKKKLRKTDLFALSSDEEDLFAAPSTSLHKSTLRSGSPKSSESIAAKKAQSIKEKPSKKPTNSLFGDVNEPLFTPSTKVKSLEVPRSASPGQKFASNTNLFNVSDSDSDLFGASANKSSSIIQVCTLIIFFEMFLFNFFNYSYF